MSSRKCDFAHWCAGHCELDPGHGGKHRCDRCGNEYSTPELPRKKKK